MHKEICGVNLASHIFLCDTAAMETIDSTLLRARAYTQAGGSKDALATASGLHRNTLSDMGNPEWSPTIKTVRKLARGLAAIEQEKGA